LAQALDTTDLLWTTNGHAGWVVETSDPIVKTFDGTDSAKSGTIFDNEESVLETTVSNGPGTLTFWWKVHSDPADPDIMKLGDRLEFYINDVLQATTNGNMAWQFRSFNIPSGTPTLKWRYVKDDSLDDGLNAGFLDQVIYTPDATAPFLFLPLSRALDTSNLDWTSGGNTNGAIDGITNGTVWIGLPNQTVLGGITNVTHDGADSAQSGAIYNSQTNWMQTTVTGATNVAFWWKVSSETNADNLEFYLNGVVQTNISGETDWQRQSFALQTNLQTLLWKYSKDGSVTEGQDRGWVDQVGVTPQQGDPDLPSPFSLTSPTRLPDGRFQLTLSGEAQRFYQILVSTNLTSWSTLTSFTNTNPNTTIVDSAASNFSRRFYKGVTPTP